MQSKAATVEQYLAELPADRREALKTVRKVILDNLDRDYAEQMQYGMIGYCVPHSVHPAGYHCDPKQPLPFGGLASQKNHMSLYLMCLYAPGELLNWFQKEWAARGKKLDMGKACIRFKKVDDLALDVIGELVRRVPARKYVEAVTKAAEATAKQPKPRPTASKKAKSASGKPASRSKAGQASRKPRSRK